MGSKHALLDHGGLLLPRHGARWPPRPMLAALAAGFLLGLLLGRWHHGHNQVVLVEHLVADGGITEPVRTSYGFKLVVHDFARQAALPGGGSSSGGSGSEAASGAASSAAATAASASAAAPAADASGGSSAFSSSSGSSSSSSRSSSSSGGGSSSDTAVSAPRFFRGAGGRASVMYSESSDTGLSDADKRRISAALKARAAQLPGDSVHALMTGNGSPYQNIQGRIMYATMKAVQAMPGGEHIKAFTRIMHRTRDDDLVGEFPTFRAYPLQPECDTWCEFPVKDRANAVVQWLMAAEQHPELIQGAWLLLLESDYAWMKPLELPGSAHDLAVAGYGFTYDYIDPAYPGVDKVMREMCPSCDVRKVPKSGPSPVLIRPAELALVAPDWEVYSAWIEGNDHAKEVLGWVREMYAWCAAVHKNGVALVHDLPPRSKLMAQPPHDATPGEAAILHYTWGTLYHDADGKEFWRFDKRDYTAKDQELKVPQFKLPPQPWRPGWKLQDGVPVRKELHTTLTAMLTAMNKASAGLPVIESVV